MKIAILMSTYNGSKYLSEQLESIAKQTLTDKITVYVRDDGSTDDTDEIIESYKKRIRIVFFKEKNVGPAKSFWILLNKNIEADYFLFSDQDDVWDSNKVEKSVNILKQGACLVACNCRIIDNNGIVKKNCRLENVPMVDIPRVFIAGYTQGCSIAFNRKVRDYIIKQKIRCVPMHDIIIILYALTIGSVVWIDEPLFSYRIHDNNVVAKNESIKKRIKTTLWNWTNSAKHSMSDVAWELLKKGDNLSINDIDFLLALSNYKKSYRDKCFLLNYGNVDGIDAKCIKSYKIRVLLNMF